MAAITGASNLTLLVNAVNMHSEDLQGLKADVAVLIEALLRQDAEAAELRSRIDALEQTALLRPYVTVNDDVFRPLPPEPPVLYKTTVTSHTSNTR